MTRNIFLAMLIMAGVFTSCVPAKKLEDANAQIAKLQSQSKDCQGKLDDANEQVSALSEKINDLNDQLRQMMSDTDALGEKYRKSLTNYDDLNALYDQTVQQNKLLLSKSSVDRLSLLDSLKKEQASLQKKEEELAD